MQHVDMGVVFDGAHEPLALFHVYSRKSFYGQCRHAGYVTLEAFDTLSMTDLSDTTRPSQLWKQLSADRRVTAADAFWRDENAAAEQVQVVSLIAQRIKFRPKSVLSMPIEKKARQLVALPVLPELVAARLLVSYHLLHQRPMMGRFLDALGVAHEEGLIADEQIEKPAADRLTAAVKTLTDGFPAEDVSLYLTTLLWQDPETWGGLTDLMPAATSDSSPQHPG